MGALQNFAGSLLDFLQLLLHGMEALDETGLVFQVGEDTLRPDDHIPHTLAGDAVIFRDLSQREVLVVVEVIKFLLALGEHIAVKVVQQSHTVCLTLQREASSRNNVKFKNFTSGIIPYLPSFVNLKNGWKPGRFLVYSPRAGAEWEAGGAEESFAFPLKAWYDNFHDQKRP